MIAGSAENGNAKCKAQSQLPTEKTSNLFDTEENSGI